MDEIGQDPKRVFRLPPGPRRWLTVAGVAGLIAATAVFGVARYAGRHRPGAPGPSGTDTGTASPASPYAPVAPGTVLLTCDSAVWSRAGRWQAGSLRVGTLWLVGGRRLGYVRLGRSQQAPSTAAGHGTAHREVEMLVHVAAGSTVVMRSAAGTWPSFQFLNSPASTGDYQGLDVGHGYTFIPCPASAGTGHGGMTDFYDVGFSIVPGHAASVEVWTSLSARPVWLTFTAPKGLT